MIWFTGLSGSGKTTIARNLEIFLIENNYHTMHLDGDNLRKGLNIGLGFSNRDREENLRRAAEVAKLMLDSGLVVIASFISPLCSQRDLIKSIIGVNNFIEIYVNTPVEECERRDVKGLYKKAREGKIADFTGVSAEYEVPKNPDITISTSEVYVEAIVNTIYTQIKQLINHNKC